MPQPSQRQVHVSRPLTNISIAYMQAATDFIADKVFPIVPVAKQADSYYVYDKNDWFRDEAEERAPGTESVGSGYSLGTDTYNCKTTAFHKDVPWDVESNADEGIDMYRDATQFVTQRLLLRRERQFAANYFTTSKWGTDLTGVSAAPGSGEVRQWSDYTNSDPVADMEVAKRLISGVTGYQPNTLVIGDEVLPYLKNHPDIIDRYKYTQAGIMTLDLIARLFELERIIVGKAIYATNKEGQAGAYDYVFGKSALLCYVNPRPGLLVPSAGYNFAWKNLVGAEGNGYGVAVSQFPMRKLKSDRVEGEMAFDQKLVATDLGVFFSTLVA